MLSPASGPADHLRLQVSTPGTWEQQVKTKVNYERTYIMWKVGPGGVLELFDSSRYKFGELSGKLFSLKLLPGLRTYARPL